MLQEKEKIQIFLAGDSTVADCPPGEEPRAGWGQLLHNYFLETVKVWNHSIGGRSSKSFIEEGRLAEILAHIKAGDFLFIQFGHNDQKKDHRKTRPFTTYQQYLKQYIDEAREKGAHPVLVTSMHRRHFNEDGRLINSLGDYPAAMMELANNEKVPCLDLWARSKTLYESLGPEESKKLFIWLKPGEHPNYPEGMQDDTHFRVEGAEAMCEILVDEIINKIPVLRKYLKK